MYSEFILFQRQFILFQQLFTFVASAVIWEGFLRRFPEYWNDSFDAINIRGGIEDRLEESLDFLKDNLPTVVHTMKYCLSRGPFGSREHDFTDITNFIHRMRREREEAGSVITQLMRIVKPEKLLFDGDSEAVDLLRNNLEFFFKGNDFCFCKPALEDLTYAHLSAVAEILYVQWFLCRENVTVQEISPELEYYIQNLDKKLLAGIMYRIAAGKPEDVDFFLENLNSLEKIKEDPLQLSALINEKSISTPACFILITEYVRRL